MHNHSRREFLAEVGQGMLLALVGPTLVGELGLAGSLDAAETAEKPIAGLEPLIALLRETPPDRLLPILAAKMEQGVSSRTLIAATALANARTFGGQDYDGYHAFMSLAPSHGMSAVMPERERALPIFKVLYRNCKLMQGKKERLTPVEPAQLPAEGEAGKMLLETVRKHKLDESDRILAALMGGKLEQAYDALQPVVHDQLNVHRVVLAWRSWETLDFTGKEHARTLLRQTVRFSCDPQHSAAFPNAGFHQTLPRLLESYKLLSATPGKKPAEDGWVEKLSQTIYRKSPAEAAEAVAAALAEGFAPEAIGEALSLAAVSLVLADKGRPENSKGEKGPGSVHGDSVGVHASDAVNAWRHIARVSNARNTFASLIAAAYHTAGQMGNQMAQPWPVKEDVEKVRGTEAAVLLEQASEAIRGRDQRRAMAVAQLYCTNGHDPQGLFALLCKIAVSEDGAKHAEKYFSTVREEFATVRPAFRDRHLVALARVSASMFGNPAPGMDEARKVLKV